MSFLRNIFAKSAQARAKKDTAEAQLIIDCIMRSPDKANAYLDDIRKTYKGRKSIAKSITMLEASLQKSKEEQKHHYRSANQLFVEPRHARCYLSWAEETERKEIKPCEAALLACRNALTAQQIEKNTGARIKMGR